MNPLLVVSGVFFLIMLVMIAKAVAIIPENQRAGVVRLGRYVKTVGPGLHVSVPLIDLVTKVDLDANIPGWQGLSERELAAAVEHFVTVGSVTGEKFARSRAATAPVSASTGTNEEGALAAWLVMKASDETGVDLSNDKVAKDRITESARGALAELRSAGSCEINLPFLTADRTGPKHFSCSVNLTQLEDIKASGRG